MPESETERFDPDREVRVDEVWGGDRLVIHQDAADPDHPLEKSALIVGKPVEVRR